MQLFFEFYGFASGTGKSGFQMLNSGEEVELALHVLFYQGSTTKDDGKLSVAFETPRLIEMGIPAVSDCFVSKLNVSMF